MSYLGLETVKPTKPMKRGDLYSFPITTIDQIVTDEETNERLPEYLANNFGMDLLWQNASPTSDFGTQTLSLNIEAGDIITIYFTEGVTINITIENTVKGYPISIPYMWKEGYYIVGRYITFTVGQITIGDAKEGMLNGSYRNADIKPLKIYKNKNM